MSKSRNLLKEWGYCYCSGSSEPDETDHVVAGRLILLHGQFFFVAEKLDNGNVHWIKYTNITLCIAKVIQKHQCIFNPVF